MLDINSIGRGSTPNNRQTNVGIAYCLTSYTNLGSLHRSQYYSTSCSKVVVYYETPSPYRKASLSAMHSTLEISLVVVDVTNVSDGCSLLKVWFLGIIC